MNLDVNSRWGVSRNVEKPRSLEPDCLEICVIPHWNWRNTVRITEHDCFFFVRTTTTIHPQDGLHPDEGSNHVQTTFLLGMWSKIVYIIEDKKILLK